MSDDDIKEPVTVSEIKAPDVDVSKFNIKYKIAQVLINEQSEFEKWLREQESTRPASFDAPEWDWRHEQGARAACEWFLNKAKELSWDDCGKGEDNILYLKDLEKACK